MIALSEKLDPEEPGNISIGGELALNGAVRPVHCVLTCQSVVDVVAFHDGKRAL